MEKLSTKTQLFWRPWLIWAVCSLFYFYIYVLQTAPNVMGFALMREFHVDALGLGNIGAYFFYPYMMMQVLIGWLLDRFGARKMMTLSITVCALGAIVFSIAPIFFIAEVGRFLMGLGAAIATVGAMALVASWFAPQRFAFLIGILGAIGMIGAMSGSGGLSVFVSWFGWRSMMGVIGVLGLLLAIAAWIIIEDQSGKGEDGIDDLVLQKPSLKVGLSRVMLNRQNWLCGSYAGLVYFPVIIIGMIWGVPFLVSVHHMGQHEAAVMMSMIFFGFMFGAPMLGWCLDRLHGNRLVLALPALGLLLTSLLIVYVDTLSSFMLSICFFCFGFFSSTELLAFTFVKNSNSPRYIGTSLGFANLLGTVGGAIFPSLVGLLLVLGWQGKIVGGIHYYSATDYHIALAIVPLLALAAFIIVPFISPLHEG